MDKEAGDVAVDSDMTLDVTTPDADGGPFLNRASVKWPMLANWAVQAVVLPRCPQAFTITVLPAKDAGLQI
jgi:hypothetical protein